MPNHIRIMAGYGLLLFATGVSAPAHAEERPLVYRCCGETELVYHNGDVELAGLLLGPLDSGEYPGAVILLSQGGHVAPLAASMGDVQFVMDLVGGALPMKEMLFHELEQTYRQHGLGDAHIIEVQKLTTASFDYIETGLGFDQYLECRARIKSRFGERLVASWPVTPDDEYWVRWRLIHDFDPVPYWRDVVDVRRIPAFIAYGELDEADNVPVKRSVQRLREELSGGTLTLRVYPDTGHSLMNEKLRAEGELILVQDLLDDLDDWISSNL